MLATGYMQQKRFIETYPYGLKEAWHKYKFNSTASSSVKPGLTIILDHCRLLNQFLRNTSDELSSVKRSQ